MLVFAPQERTQRNGSAKQWRLVHREPGFVYIVADWLRSFPGRGRSTWPSCLGIRPKTASSQRDILCIYKRTRFAFFIWVLQYAVLHTTCEKSKKLAYMFHWLSDTHKTLTSLTTTLPRGRNSWCEHVSNMHRYYTRIPMFHKPWVLVYHLSPLLFFAIFLFFLFLLKIYSDKLGKVSENPEISQHSIPDPFLPYKHMVGGGPWGTGGGGEERRHWGGEWRVKEHLS